MIRKAYVDGTFGQIHARMTPPVAGQMPLIALHATAYSSQSFLPLMQAMAGQRQIIAIDAPGYGESDAPAQPVSMAEYADATIAAINQLADGPVAVLGYHTGCYVATEMAIQWPEKIAALVMIGVPYFQALDFEFWKDKLGARHELTDQLSQFEERWGYFITNRHESVTLQRGFQNFVDELKAWPDGSWAHEAMFAYDSDNRLPQVQQLSLIWNPAGHLAFASQAAAALMPAATLLERSEVSGPVLECAAVQITADIQKYLSDVAG